MDDVFLNKITYEFSQEGNYNGTTAEDEVLIVEVESAHSSISKDGGFLTLRTSTGWSINNSEELLELLKVVEKGVPSEQKQ